MGAGKRFGISRLTAVKVFDKLKEAGLIRARSGSGTFVTKQGASRKLGVIVPLHAYSEIFTKIVGVLSRPAQEAGYTLVFGDVSSTSHSARERMAKSMARRFVEEGVAGVIFMPIDFLSDAERVNREVLKIFDDTGIAVVLCDYDIVSPPKRSGYDVVGINNVEAGAAMV
jgi:LacI family transcriptional regulator